MAEAPQQQPRRGRRQDQRQQRRARRRRPFARPHARCAASGPPPPPPTPLALLLVLPALLLLLLLPAATAAASTPTPPTTSDPLVRVFVDEGLFLEGETEVLRAHAAASPGGALRVTGESTGAFLSVKGYYAPDSWDLYVTVGSACRKAWPFMRAAQLGGGGGGESGGGGDEAAASGGSAPAPPSPPSPSSSPASSSYLPHQWVNCVPGAFALTAKRAMVETLQEAYGELAFTGLPSSSSSSSSSSSKGGSSSSGSIAPITPRAYALPGQYWAWRSYLRAARLPPDTTWVLKREVHRGKGVSLLPQREAARKARPGGGGEGEGEGGNGYPKKDAPPPPPPVLVQSFLRDQLLVEGRRSYLRVWMVVTSVAPVRAYLFDGGFAIFSSSSASSSSSAAGKAPQSAAASGTSSSNGTSGDDGGVVNLWNQDRSQSRIWALKDLAAWVDARAAEEEKEQEGGGRTGPPPRAWANAWRDMRAAAGLAAMAAAPAMRADADEGQAPPRGTFEYFGLDFVLDAGRRPWLLEVNAVPSMARRRRDSGCAGRGFGGDGGGGGAGSSAAAAGAVDCSLEGDGGDGFDAQKERFVHDVLALIGAPVAGQKAAGGGEEEGRALPPPLPPSGPPLSAEAAALRCAAADAHALLLKRRRRGGGGGGGKGLEQQQQQEEEAASPFAPPPCDAAALAALAQARSAAAAAALSSSSSSSAPPPHPRRIPARDLVPLLCADDGAGSPSPSSPPPRPPTTDGGGCWRPGCLTPRDLSALAEAEAEASRGGHLLAPVHDALAARRLNRAAVDLKRASGYGDDGDDGNSEAAFSTRQRQPRWSNHHREPLYSPLAELARSALPRAIRDAPPPRAPGAAARLRAWFVAWLLPESGAPQLLRARPRVDGAVRALNLTREDYLLAAWARTTKPEEAIVEEEEEGSRERRRAAHNGPRARLRRLAAKCFAS